MAALAILLLVATPPAHAAGRVLLTATAAKAADTAASSSGRDQFGSPYWGGGGGALGGPATPLGYSGYGRRAAGSIRPRLSRRWQRYDPSYLSGLVPASLPRNQGRAGPLSPDAARLSQALATASAASAANSWVNGGGWGGGGGYSNAVAQAIVDSAARGRGTRISDAMASAAAINQDRTAQVLALSANEAMLRGQVDPFAAAAADAFAASRRRGSIRSFGLAMADACAQGGQYGQYAYGNAIAKAIADGGDSQAAVAEATAEVYCSGIDDYASAWSTAFAVALSQDQNGCLVLSKARALAVASCGGGAFNSYSDSDSTAKVLGFCGLFPPGAGPQFGFSSTDSGSNDWGGRRK